MAYRRADGISYEMSGDRAVILDAEGTVMTTLNPIGSIIWRALDGVRDAANLAQDLAGTFDGVGPERLEADIAEFTESLVAASLVSSG